MTPPIDRRTFLRRSGGAAVLGIAGAAGLDACSGSKKPARASAAPSASGGTAGSPTSPAVTAAPPGAKTVGGTPVPAVASGVNGRLDVQLPWVKDVESAGEFVADSSGYYAQLGFSPVTLVPGGPSAVPQETQVETGRVLLAITSLDAAAAAVQRGRPLVVLGAEYQKSPFCIMSLESKPLNTPQDMVGKRIGVQPPNDAVWSAFLNANRIDSAKVTKVPVQFDPTALAAGQVDGWFSFITNEPIELGLAGVKTTTFLLNDFNYPEVGNVLIVNANTLKTARDKVKAAMTAEIIAWRESIQKPDEGAALSVQKYGTALRLPSQQQQSRAQNALMATGDALTSGLFYVSPVSQQANVRTLAVGGTTVTAAQLFDMTVLDEIYQAYPSIKTVPTPGT